METRTTLETMERVWDIENIKKLIHKRCFYIANEWHEKELNDLWVSEEAYQKSASFGRNTGYYVGMDEIRRYYVENYNNKMGDGKGYLSNHPTSTGLVRVAEDGKTAKGMWYSIAQETRPEEGGEAMALWMPEKIAVDFVREADGWKIWHIVIANDLVCEAGTNYELGDVYVDHETDPVSVEFGQPTIAKLLHDQTFNWWDNYPPMPQPYETWSDEISYGPEGYPKSDTFHFGAKEGGNFK